MAAQLWLLGALFVGAQALSCDRVPEGRRYSDKTPADGHFTLEIEDDPKSYIPNMVYRVTIKGETEGSYHRFIGFLLVAESDEGHDRVGSFQITGLMTKFSDKCRNAVTSTNITPKEDVKSIWTAPPSGSGCITLKATVIEHQEIWHMDDPSLIKTICEVDDNTGEADSVVDPCCACDEAKYEVTFEGLWSRHTHPRNFPPNNWLTRFSDVIGASHAADYRFWTYGQHASEGLRQLAQDGETKVLESELKSQSNHIRTIIKARGISFPNLTGKTFAVFRVDNRHHLMSLVSMINPSPDWIVGVSGLELCLTNCSWVESKVINLFPWDAGTDSGRSYLDPDTPTSPRDVIRKISTTDSESPFYDSSGKEMKPLARLYLSRQRLYEKVCEGDGDGDSTAACAVTAWREWSPCTVTCGKGLRYRSRQFLNQNDADQAGCKEINDEREPCWGARRHCRIPSEYEPDPAQKTGPCAMTEWSAWSGCSEKCGRGNQVRTRRFKYKGAFKRCHQGLNTRPAFEQTIPCVGISDDCPEYGPDSEGSYSPANTGGNSNDGGNSNFEDTDNIKEPEERDEMPDPNPECHTTPWTPWTPCSVDCGEGVKIRTRDFKKNQYKSKSFSVIPLAVVSTLGNKFNHNQDRTRNRQCRHIILREEVSCEGTEPNCDVSNSEAREMCSLPKKVGPCRGYFERWFFDVAGKTCEPFGYTGCQGNKNNFRTNKECWRVCRSYREDLDRIEKILDEDINEDENLLDEASSSSQYDVTMQNDDIGDIDEPTQIQGFSIRNQRKCKPKLAGDIPKPGITGDRSVTGYDNNPELVCPEDEDGSIISEPVGEVTDCIVSAWSQWSSCDSTCGLGYRKKTRRILINDANGGKKCPTLQKVQSCNNKPCRNFNDPDYEQPEVTYPTWGPGDISQSRRIDCQLSEWSKWSPCAATCGYRAIKQRTRSILIYPDGGGKPCESRIQKKSCDRMPCPNEY